MASTDALPIPRKNTAYRATFTIRDANGDLLAGATSLDSEVSKDAGAFSDCTNEATEIAQGFYYLDLTSTEMNADTVAVIVKSSGKPTAIIIYPEEAGDVRVDVVQISGDGTAADNAEAMFDGTGYAGGTIKLDTNVVNVAGTAAQAASGRFQVDVELWLGSAPNALSSGRVDVTVGAMQADTLTASALAADAVTEIQNGLATAANLATVAGYVDTEVAAIKTVVDAIQAKTDNLPSDPADASVVAGLIAAVEAKVDTVDTVVDAVKVKTDSLTFTVAGQVDSNVVSVNDLEVGGTGTEADPWNPA